MFTSWIISSRKITKSLIIEIDGLSYTGANAGVNITSLVGTESYHGKHRVERRLEQIEADKEANKETALEGQLEVSNV